MGFSCEIYDIKHRLLYKQYKLEASDFGYLCIFIDPQLRDYMKNSLSNWQYTNYKKSAQDLFEHIKQQIKTELYSIRDYYRPNYYRPTHCDTCFCNAYNNYKDFTYEEIIEISGINNFPHCENCTCEGYFGRTKDEMLKHIEKVSIILNIPTKDIGKITAGY